MEVQQAAPRARTIREWERRAWEILMGPDQAPIARRLVAARSKGEHARFGLDAGLTIMAAMLDARRRGAA